MAVLNRRAVLLGHATPKPEIWPDRERVLRAVRFHYVARRPVHHNLPFFKPDRSIAKVGYHLGAVRSTQHRYLPAPQLANPPETFLLKTRVANG